MSDLADAIVEQEREVLLIQKNPKLRWKLTVWNSQRRAARNASLSDAARAEARKRAAAVKDEIQAQIARLEDSHEHAHTCLFTGVGTLFLLAKSSLVRLLFRPKPVPCTRWFGVDSCDDKTHRQKRTVSETESERVIAPVQLGNGTVPFFWRSSMTYSDKLLDPRWQKKRLEIYSRDEFTCQDCEGSDKTLTVHHLYYIKDRDPWNYPAWALQTLCVDCHRIAQKTATDELHPFEHFLSLVANSEDELYSLFSEVDDVRCAERLPRDEIVRRLIRGLRNVT